MNYSYGLQGYNSYTTPALYPTIHTTRSGTMAFHSHTSPYPNGTIPRKVNTPASTDTFVQQNAQLRQSIISTAQELGFTDPKELQTLNNRLQNAQIEVNNQDPTKTLNVRQKAQSDVKAQNKILSLALFHKGKYPMKLLLIPLLRTMPLQNLPMVMALEYLM